MRRVLVLHNRKIKDAKFIQLLRKVYPFLKEYKDFYKLMFETIREKPTKATRKKFVDKLYIDSDTVPFGDPRLPLYFTIFKNADIIWLRSLDNPEQPFKMQTNITNQIKQVKRKK